MCIAHVQIVGTSLEETKKFYLAALAPLEYKELYTLENNIGLGADHKPDFWIRSSKGAEDAPTKGMHIAFNAATREKVDEFHAAAIKAGAVDNGAPGLRPYAPGYYAAFILDPQGNNIEVMHFKPECQATA